MSNCHAGVRTIGRQDIWAKDFWVTWVGQLGDSTGRHQKPHTPHSIGMQDLSYDLIIRDNNLTLSH